MNRVRLQILKALGWAIRRVEEDVRIIKDLSGEKVLEPNCTEHNCWPCNCGARIEMRDPRMGFEGE